MPARTLILNNIWWKLLSLLLAALTWFTIDAALRRGQSQAEQSPVVTTVTGGFPTVPITLMMAAGNTNQFKVSPATVAVQVSGTPEEIKKLRMEQITAYVDLTEAPDEREVRRDIQVHAPRGFKIENLNPLYATVEKAGPGP